MVWLATWPMLSPVISAYCACSFFAMALGNAHHVAAHDDGGVVLVALLVDLHLNVA